MRADRKYYAEPGQRFGRLVVVRETEMRYGAGNRVWGAVCSCDCGREITTQLRHLFTGKSRSCGCLNGARVTEGALLEFLRARLDEDEAARHEVHKPRACGSVDRDGEFSSDPVWCSCDGPARVLREVEAKRRIIAAELDRATGDCLPGEFVVLLALASIWRDHPDCRPEWAA